MLGPGNAGSNTVTDHLAVLDAAVTALPPRYRRRLMVTCDGAGASHGLIARLDQLASRPGYQLVYSVGWDLGADLEVANLRARVRVEHEPGVRRSFVTLSWGDVAIDERRFDPSDGL